MKIYDYVTATVIEISDAQYEFMQNLMKHSGKESEAREESKVSAEVFESWKNDPVFWPIVQGYVKVLIQSRGLTPEYLKSYLLSTIAGNEKPTNEQLKAIGHSVRALGMGLQNRTFSGKATITPDNTTIEFNDGLDAEVNDKH